MTARFLTACAAAVLWPLLTAGSCATTSEPRVETVEVKVIVRVPCVSDAIPRPPAYPDTDEALRAAKSGADRYALIGAGRKLRDQRLAEIEPTLDGCRRLP